MTGDTGEAVEASCAWWCRFCRACHDNACPTLWGGDFVPGRCGHFRPQDSHS